MDSETTKFLLTASLPIIGVLIGSYITYRNSFNLFRKQKEFDNQRISYSKLKLTTYGKGLKAQNLKFEDNGK